MTEISFARFDGKVALITGAANGICRVSAEIIAAEGGTIAAVDNDGELLDGAVEAFAAAGGGAHHAYPADVLAQEEVDAVVADVVDRFGKIDILINGVGGSTIIANSGARTEELTMEEWQKVLDFNLSGTFLFCHAVIPHMTRQGGGKIVNFASIAGRGRAPVVRRPTRRPRVGSSRSPPSSPRRSVRRASTSTRLHLRSPSPSASVATGRGGRRSCEKALSPRRRWVGSPSRSIRPTWCVSWRRHTRTSSRG